ncbi:hypothetical protein CAP40_06555 [Sphingomonas sp. IBVSS2]|nr:hypothetical protein CAP40_06555 [Sphingomonas sp. IBVSS2]
MLLASSPSLAAPCPASREEGRKFLAGLTKLGPEMCFHPCARAFKYDAAGQKALGVQPLAILDRSELQAGLSAVIHVLPGPLGKYAAGFKKAFPGASCNSFGDSCYLVVQNAGENALRQVLLSVDGRTKDTWLHCNFELMD